jgi:hypothetical protein
MAVRDGAWMMSPLNKPQNGRKPTPKWEKAYPKMGENSVKIFKSYYVVDRKKR